MSQQSHETSNQLIHATAGFFLVVMAVMPIAPGNARVVGGDKTGARTIHVGTSRAAEFGKPIMRPDGSKRAAKKCVATHKRHACR